MIIRSTTILCLRKDRHVADGLRRPGDARHHDHEAEREKLRRMYNDTVLAGFAAPRPTPSPCSRNSRASCRSTGQPHAGGRGAREGLADGPGVAPAGGAAGHRRPEHSLIVSGTGDVIEPEDGILAIGSGGPYALAAARALLRFSTLDARAVVEESMKIAGGIDIYTNLEITLEELKG